MTVAGKEMSFESGGFSSAANLVAGRGVSTPSAPTSNESMPRVYQKLTAPLRTAEGCDAGPVAAAGSAGAVDITLGGSIDMGVEFGVGKDKGSMSIGDAYNSISLSIAAAGTTDAGLKYGASFSFACGTACAILAHCFPCNGTATAHDEVAVDGAVLDELYFLPIFDGVSNLAAPVAEFRVGRHGRGIGVRCAVVLRWKVNICRGGRRG